MRTVEWLRDNGARGLVDRVENLYYSLTAPSKGGPPLKALPTQSGVVGITPGATPPIRFHLPQIHHYRPPNIPPVIHSA
ncbi:MAG TPA: hypothetical protein VHZ27_16570, partial [Solirubrobacteraceae bacterium]|nr:hypothetical protein [Solirubrobacteraceae bacterium]